MNGFQDEIGTDYGTEFGVTTTYTRSEDGTVLTGSNDVDYVCDTTGKKLGEYTCIESFGNNIWVEDPTIKLENKEIKVDGIIVATESDATTTLAAANSLKVSKNGVDQALLCDENKKDQKFDGFTCTKNEDKYEWTENS